MLWMATIHVHIKIQQLLCQHATTMVITPAAATAAAKGLVSVLLTLRFRLSAEIVHTLIRGKGLI